MTPERMKEMDWEVNFATRIDTSLPFTVEGGSRGRSFIGREFIAEVGGREGGKGSGRGYMSLRLS